MKRILSRMTQSSSSKKADASYRQQIVILLLMTCFAALTLTAPTSPSLAITTTILNGEAVEVSKEVSDAASSSTLKDEPITTQEPSIKHNEDSPASVTVANLDTITSYAGDDKTMKSGLFATTTNENLIVRETQAAEGFSMGMHSEKYDNGTIKIHEANESVDSSSTTSPMPSTVKSDLSDSSLQATEASENNKNKSIKSDGMVASRNGIVADVTSPDPNDIFPAAQFVPTTIEMPIKLDAADNSKIMENERDFSTSTSQAVHPNGEAKKGKLKESKKKALKAQGRIDKKQKLKQKFYTDINHPTIVPTNEPTTASTAAAQSLEKATELYETTDAATISTSIKTAPTTIKSTTLTTIKTFQLDSDTTEPLTKADFATESALHINEMEAETTTEPSVTANEQHNRNGDNVIVLNTNSSGLIVVDIMENFGTENASNNTETFEIKMDLIDDATVTEESRLAPETNKARMLETMQEIFGKDDIFLTTIETPLSIDSNLARRKSSKIDSATTTANDDIILINENAESTATPTTHASNRIKWNQVRTGEGDGSIKITFDNIDLPNQNVNVSIENGELVIDSIDISVLNKAEEELRKKKFDVSHGGRKLNKTDSLEIILIEDDSHQDEKEIDKDNLGENDESIFTTTTVVNDEGERRINESIGEEFRATTIHFELPSVKQDHLKKIEVGGSEEEDGIKIKTTDKDSDTIFYISNTEVKVIESIPTTAPNTNNVSHERKYYPAIYEEDVIVDLPSNRNRTSGSLLSDKYEEDIVLSPLTSDFDPKDINYIGEAFLDVEESQNGVGMSESHHIIPLTSDVVIQPVQLRDSPPVGVPIIGELPPQIELEEMVFSDDYDSKQQSSFRVEEYYPNFLTNRLVKTQLDADVPREVLIDSKNVSHSPNRTHISVNTMINGTNMTTVANSFPNGTAFLVESSSADETVENAGELTR